MTCAGDMRKVVQRIGGCLCLVVTSLPDRGNCNISVHTRYESEVFLSFLFPLSHSPARPPSLLFPSLSLIRASNMEEKHELFWKQGDFGYVKDVVDSMMTLCKPQAKVMTNIQVVHSGRRVKVEHMSSAYHYPCWQASPQLFNHFDIM